MTSSRWHALVAAAVAAMFAAAPALGLERGMTADGRAYASGGIGLGEREELAQLRSAYRLRVATAARLSGAYLAAVQVTIADAGGRRIFDRALAGPLLLVDLAPGRYTVEATNRQGQTQRVQTTIAASGQREIYFYFDVPGADVRPKEELPR